jgi:hypothetical protein
MKTKIQLKKDKKKIQANLANPQNLLLGSWDYNNPVESK